MTQIGQPEFINDNTIPLVRPRVLEKFHLLLHDFDPAAMVPTGDRYIVETIPVEETVKFGSFVVVANVGGDTNPRDPSGNPAVERRGVLPAVIIAAGNGHLLGLPDHKIVVDGKVVREPADVPIFFTPGDVVLLDMNAKGRSLMIVDREIRVVNQMDCLVKLPLRLEWTETGWQREGEAGDQAV